MIFHLLGAGAIGSLAAYYLQQAGFPVAVLPRLGAKQTPASVVNRKIYFPNGQESALSLPVDHARQIDRLLVATKAGQTQAAITPWLPRLSDNALLIGLQNGMGQWEGVAWPAGVEPVIGITQTGATRQGSQITVIAENATWMGQHQTPAPDWFQQLQMAWPDLHWDRTIHRRQLSKLAVNALINPLTAIHDCPNGNLLTVPQYHADLVALAAEVDTVLQAVDPSWPGNSLAQAEKVAELTAQNTSSMRADVQAGRATEIRFINGWLANQARQHGIPAPFNDDLCKRLAS